MLRPVCSVPLGLLANTLSPVTLSKFTLSLGKIFFVVVVAVCLFFSFVLFQSSVCLSSVVAVLPFSFYHLSTPAPVAAKSPGCFLAVSPGAIRPLSSVLQKTSLEALQSCVKQCKQT